MAGTRSSARQNGSSPSNQSDSAGTKRKAEDTSPSSAKKRGRPAKATKQQTLEQSVPNGGADESKDDKGKLADEGKGKNVHENGSNHLTEMEDVEPERNGTATNGNTAVGKAGESYEGENKEGESKSDPEKALKDSRGGAGMNALDQVKADENDAGTTGKEDKDEGHADPVTNGEAKADAIEEDKKREDAQPSNILEKGIIYFFTRGRVGVDNPESVQDLQRSFFVMRPLADGAKITDGAIQDVSNNRLIALPKKVWPKSGKDKFMVFIEKAGVGMDTLKEEFFAGSEYSTKTTGTRQTPDVTPIGEGVYAMTSTGGGQGTTHLAYMLTIPSEPGEVQADVGLAAKGSFVMSLKNPESSGPANAQLPQGPDYPKEFIDEFRGRGWMPAHPKHIDYANAQCLLIGESFDDSNNLEAAPKDAKDDSKETPQEELEKLEHEDELRVEHLKGDDTVFADLGISSRDYPKVMTTW